MAWARLWMHFHSGHHFAVVAVTVGAGLLAPALAAAAAAPTSGPADARPLPGLACSAADYATTSASGCRRAGTAPTYVAGEEDSDLDVSAAIQTSHAVLQPRGEENKLVGAEASFGLLAAAPQPWLATRGGSGNVAGSIAGSGPAAADGGGGGEALAASHGAPTGLPQLSLLNSVAQEAALAFAEGEAARNANEKLRQEIAQTEQEGLEARQQLSLLRARDNRLRREIAAAETAAARGRRSGAVAVVGGRHRRVVLLAVAGAGGLVVVVAVIGCAVAAASWPKSPGPRSVGGGGGDGATTEGEATATSVGGGEEAQGSQQVASMVDAGGRKRRKRRQGIFCVAAQNVIDFVVGIYEFAWGFLRAIPMALHYCFCGCSFPVLIASWVFVACWSAGIVLLWHLGIVQPFLKQILVYVYFVIGIASMAAIVIAESMSHFTALFEQAYATVQFVHDKVDDVLEAIGLDTLEGTPTNPNQASQGADSSDAAEQPGRQRETQHKPIPYGPAWFIQQHKQAKSGCC